MLLEIENLAVSYGKMAALHGISLRVAEGSITSIIGANGAGKSTLLNAVSGVVRYTGKIALGGAALPRLPHKVVETGIVQVPEGRRVFSALTVEENLSMGAYTVRDKRLIRERLNNAYNLFPILQERSKQFAGTLSGGEKTRLALATLVVSSANVLLLDEPTNNLDPASREEVLSALRTYEGAIVLVTHDPGAVDALSPDRVVVMPEGVEDSWSDDFSELVALA